MNQTTFQKIEQAMNTGRQVDNPKFRLGEAEKLTKYRVIEILLIKVLKILGRRN